MKDQSEQIIKDCKESIIDRIKDKLKDYDGLEIYFHDIVSEEIDNFTPQNRQDCLNLIDTADEQYFDSGLIDLSSLDRTLITMAYCALEQNLFNDDVIQELQNKLNNEVLSQDDANELLNYLKENGY